MRRRTLFQFGLGLSALFALALLAANPAGPRLFAAEENKPAVVTEKSASTDAPPPGGVRRIRGRDHEFMTALALWCMIVVVGLALLAMTIVWGRSLRSLARRKPSPPTAPDPLWYLKTKPPLPAAPAASDASRRPDDSDSGSQASSRTPL
jgi:hypothetical protein